jgi:hypothetical protein
LGDDKTEQTKSAARREREATALRQNLARRKAQQRSREADPPSGDGESRTVRDSTGATGKAPR